MNNLIFVISICVFVSFSFAFSNYSTSESYYATTDFLNNLFSTEKKLLNFSSPPHSSEPENDSAENQAEFGVTDIANMLNERGFYKSNGFSFDEEEIVNDFNGNLMFRIPLYNFNLAGDLSFDITLNYNGSVGHQFFPGYINTYNGDMKRYNMNCPEWIINFNGIGVQTLNFETNFFSTKYSSSNEKSKDVMGYDYKNRKPPRKKNVKQILDKLDFTKKSQIIRGVRKKNNESGGKAGYINKSEFEIRSDTSKLILPLEYTDYDSTKIKLVKDILFFEGYMIFEFNKNQSNSNSKFIRSNVFWIDSLANLDIDSLKYCLCWPNLSFNRYIFDKIEFYEAKEIKNKVDSIYYLEFEKFREYYDDYLNLSIFKSENLPFTRIPITTSIFSDSINFLSHLSNDSVGYFIFKSSFYCSLLSANLVLVNEFNKMEYRDMKIFIPISKAFILKPISINEISINLKKAKWYPQNLFHTEN